MFGWIKDTVSSITGWLGSGIASLFDWLLGGLADIFTAIVVCCQCFWDVLDGLWDFAIGFKDSLF